MKPLNQPERQTRLWQFAGLYLLALLIPVGASYYLFSNKSIADENAKLKLELDRTHDEQARLRAQFDTLTHHLQRIAAVDQQILTNNNAIVVGQLVARNQDYLNAIAVSQNELRRDSAQLLPAHRRVVRDVLADFDLFRSTHTIIDGLNQKLVHNGDENSACQRTAQQLAQSQARVNSLEQSLAVCNNKPPCPTGGGGDKKEVKQENKGKIALLEDQVAFAKADCLRERAMDKKLHSRERRRLLEQARTQFIQIMQDPATEDLKNSIIQTLEPINIELGRPPRFFGLIPN